MKIVVTTRTGHVGSRVVHLLCQAGVRPVLAMRHPDRLDERTRAYVDTVEVDQDGRPGPHGALLDETGASVVHLRCGYFFTNLLLDLDGLREGVLRTTMPLDLPVPWVDPRDIGDVAAARCARSA